MGQEFIGTTEIKKSNKKINQFMKTTDVDYFNDEQALQKAVDFIRSQDYTFEIDDCEACISGKDFTPTNIPAIADSTKEAIFLAIETFAGLRNDNKI